jgi:hypothetical protein
MKWRSYDTDVFVIAETKMNTPALISYGKVECCVSFSAGGTSVPEYIITDICDYWRRAAPVVIRRRACRDVSDHADTQVHGIRPRHRLAPSPNQGGKTRY